jgi:hypothetical protein
MRKKESLILKRLVEAVILQAVEDLWSKADRKESIDFFSGEGFSCCARAAGMELDDQIRLLHMVNGVLKRSDSTPGKFQETRRSVHAGRSFGNITESRLKG